MIVARREGEGMQRSSTHPHPHWGETEFEHKGFYMLQAHNSISSSMRLF